MPSTKTGTFHIGSSLVNAIYDASGKLLGGFRRKILDYFPAPDTLPAQVLLRKLRTDYPEFAVYTPTTADGIHWARWYFTNRFNTGNVGSTRMTRCSPALLYASTPRDPIAENLTTQVQSIAPTATTPTSGASARVGTWTASATVAGVTDTRYSTTVGDYVEYQGVIATQGGRLQLRTQQNTTNGGIVDVTVKDGSGTLITDSRLLQPATAGVMTINLKVMTGCYHLPIADGLAPGTYTVRVTVAASNPASGRAYDCGFETYAGPVPVTTQGQLGTWENRTLVGTVATNVLPGGVRVYTFTGTRVAWRFGQSTNSGIANLRVYDSAGVEIAAQYYKTASRAFDTYFAANAKSSVAVAAGLPYGNYTIRIETANAKNAASTGYRVYDYGPVAYNENQAGVVGVDEFDDLGTTDATASNGIIFIGVGNLELAIKARRPDEPQGSPTDAFVGGVHGSETNPANLVLKVSGSTIDFAAGAVNAQWVGSSVGVTFDTNLKLLIDASVFAAATYSFFLDAEGYRTDVGRTYTAASIISEDYSMMLNVPSRQEGTYGAAGGFETFFAFPDSVGASRTFPLHTDHSNPLPKRLTDSVWFNAGYVISGEQLNWSEIDASFSAPILQSSREKSQVQERTDRTVKNYNRCFPGSPNGVAVPIGTAGRTKAQYRIAPRS